MTVLTMHPTGQPAVQYVDADPDRWEVLADRLKAVADPTRLRLLDAVRSLPQQRGCVSEITAATGLPQPTVSRHLQVLHRAELLDRTRQGSRTFYQLNNQALESVARDLATPHPSDQQPATAATRQGSSQHHNRADHPRPDAQASANVLKVRGTGPVGG